MGFERTTGTNVTVHYGPRDTDEKYGGTYGSKDEVKRVEWTFDYNDLPSEDTANNLEATVPANATVVSAKLEIITGFTSTSTTTDLTVGLAFASNTDDPDGLVTAANATQTTIATAGNLITGSGAFVGATIGDEAGQLTVAPTVADLLTGRARVVVEYIL